MNWTNYVFVFYIFILLAGLIYIWTKASKGKLDERIRLLEEKQREIIALQNDTKDSILVFETYMYEAKENLENERKKIEYLITKFEDMLEEQEKTEKAKEKRREREREREAAAAHTIAEAASDVLTEGIDDEEETQDKGELYEEISKMSKKGYSLDEIVKKLGISKGEANFILGITK